MKDFHFTIFEYPRVYPFQKNIVVLPRHFRLELFPFRRPVCGFKDDDKGENLKKTVGGSALLRKEI